MDTQSILEYEWPYLVSFLPSEEVLERSAREFNALTRKRNINSASTLLRLAFAYGFCGMSLRHTAAWAYMMRLADLSAVALLKRLRQASDWLGYLLYIKLTERALPPATSSLQTRIRIVDATCISRPGSRTADWRIHFCFDLSRLTITQIDVTDQSGGESLRRFRFAPGELILADRGYAHRAGLHAVVRAHADFLVRCPWRMLPLRSADGAPFGLFDALRSLPDGAPGEFPVVIAKTDDYPALPVRLLAVRKSEHAAERTRKQALYEGSRKQRPVDTHTLEAAGYTMIVTSVAPARLSTFDGLDLYRFRWQIELAFKRLKTILRLDDLPAKDPALARSMLYTKLLAALMLEDLTEDYLGFSPWGFRLEPPSSLPLAYSTDPR